MKRYALISVLTAALTGCGSGTTTTVTVTKGSNPTVTTVARSRPADRSAGGVRATLSEMEAALRARKYSELCERYYTRKGAAFLAAFGGGSCTRGLAAGVAGAEAKHEPVTIAPDAKVTVHGPRAVVISRGERTEMRYEGGGWRIEVEGG